MAAKKFIYRVEVFGGGGGCIFSGVSAKRPEAYGDGFKYNDLRTGDEVIVSGTVVIAKLAERRKTGRK